MRMFMCKKNCSDVKFVTTFVLEKVMSKIKRSKRNIVTAVFLKMVALKTYVLSL